ncbi:sterol desaturase family protein [Zavarzinia compransoris]|uniref:Sterol desaturase family protein n=1 Tax=Zavarzinia compransoris TaxID=1264899 RepID=A0A317EA28_9PROT|nr:sterol desaturase family protein [Zavarzinia compransoris]PWR23779.1 sterol desaturase family protein [Zavarzinia compransoris]TDP48009.1 sterol desaturase/sphingolipid hydroxylase (fatty acid hydroxylase superfamily) [Zavarzinia compransoris]
MEAIAQSLEQWLGGPVDWKQIILIGLTPVFLAAFAVEWFVMARRGRLRQFSPKQIFTNLNLGGAYQVFELIGHALVFMAAMHWVYDHRIADVPLNLWTAPLLFLLVEFCYYWFHRTSHRVRWFWCAHVVHHSGEEMNLTTAMRQSMLYSLTGYWLFFTPLMLIGISPEWTLALYALNLAYQYFVHTEAVDKLPAWVEYVFVTPSHHRAHHGRNPQYIDKNYGGVLILFDRLFGTFEPEVEKVDYGIVRQVRSTNILTLNLHEFIDMMRDVMRPGPLWLRLKHLWAPPEWARPDHKKP